MDYKKVLGKLESLRKIAEKIYRNNSGDTSELSLQYGGVEDVYQRLAGISKVEVSRVRGEKATYANYFEAGYLSGYTTYRHEGYMELLKIIGKASQLADDPAVPQVEYSLVHLIQTLRRFRECCQYLKQPPANEKEVQDIIWIMLRSQYETLIREEVLPKFGSKSYKPDFGIPDIRTLIEVKFIGEKTAVATIQEETLADIPAYLQDVTSYDNIVALVYDCAHKLRDSRKFTEDIKKVDGVSDIIIIPGVG